MFVIWAHVSLTKTNYKAKHVNIWEEGGMLLPPLRDYVIRTSYRILLKKVLKHL